jgi:hypothetical protein
MNWSQGKWHNHLFMGIYLIQTLICVLCVIGRGLCVVMEFRNMVWRNDKKKKTKSWIGDFVETIEALCGVLSIRGKFEHVGARHKS